MRAFFLLMLTATILNGCSSEEPMVPSDEPSPDKSDYLYLDFNKWVYGQMNQQYLWREDMPDSLFCNYELSPSEFFKSLLSSKDRFSYLTKNPNYSGQSEYGFAYQLYEYKGQDKIFEILYIHNPELIRQGMRRGDFISIRKSNGFYIYTKLNIADNSIHNSGITYREPIDTRTIGNSSSVLLDSVYQINNKKIGYICYLEFNKVSDLDKPLKKMYNSQIDELIIDLRYNPGGYVNTCQFLCNCILPSYAYDCLFQKCTYNNIISEEYLKTTGFPYTFSKFKTPLSLDENVLGTSIIPLNQKRVYFITSSHTASASEAAIICLRPYMEVVVIGEPTVGKGVGSWTIYDSKYKYAIQPITMRYYNALDETTPDEGLAPDYYVTDVYTTPKRDIGNKNELLLNTAINIILGQSNITTSVDKITLRLDVDGLRPIGEPSFVTEFRNKQFREMNIYNQ